MLDITAIAENGAAYLVSSEDFNLILALYRSGSGPTNSTTLRIESDELFINIPGGGIERVASINGAQVNQLLHL